MHPLTNLLMITLGIAAMLIGIAWVIDLGAGLDVGRSRRSRLKPLLGRIWIAVGAVFVIVFFGNAVGVTALEPVSAAILALFAGS